MQAINRFSIARPAPGRVAALAIAFLFFVVWGAAHAQRQSEPQKGKEMAQTKNELFEGEVNAPDFPLGLDMHIIPDLKKLEAKYANQLVVIGVHSANSGGA
jgi:hypothetical protein